MSKELKAALFGIISAFTLFGESREAQPPSRHHWASAPDGIAAERNR